MSKQAEQDTAVDMIDWVTGLSEYQSKRSETKSNATAYGTNSGNKLVVITEPIKLRLRLAPRPPIRRSGTVRRTTDVAEKVPAATVVDIPAGSEVLIFGTFLYDHKGNVTVARDSKRVATVFLADKSGQVSVSTNLICTPRFF